MTDMTDNTVYTAYSTWYKRFLKVEGEVFMTTDAKAVQRLINKRRGAHYYVVAAVS